MSPSRRMRLLAIPLIWMPATLAAWLITSHKLHTLTYTPV